VTADPAGHPNVESLDDYANGENACLDVDRHVRACGECREAVAALRRVRADLASLAHVTMPPDVAARIQAALDAVPAGSAGPGWNGGPDAAGRAGASRRRARIRRRAVRRSDVVVTMSAACLVLVVVLAAVFATRGPHLDAQPSATGAEVAPASAAAEAEAAGAATATATGGAQSADEPAGDAGAAVPETDGRTATDRLAAPAPAAGAAPDAAAAPPAVAVTDTLLAEADLARHVNNLLDGRITTRSVAAEQQLVNPPLLTCYRDLAVQAGGDLLALDRVRYLGRPAVLVALSVPGVPGSVRAVVINIDCDMAAHPLARWGDEVVVRPR
jgi:hypothetical protein